MKKDRVFRFLVLVLFLAMILGMASKVKASDIKENESRIIRTTFYIDRGVTKDGSQTREGIAAMNDYYLGATVVLYRLNENGSRGEMIGIFEIKDTGGNKDLKRGKRIDLWMPSLDEGWNFVDEFGDYTIADIYFDCVG